jgi:hypothetical protein
MTTLPIQNVNALSAEEQQLLLTLLIQKAGLTIAENIQVIAPLVQEVKPVTTQPKPKKLTRKEKQDLRFQQLINYEDCKKHTSNNITFSDVTNILTHLQGNDIKIYSHGLDLKMNYTEYNTSISRKNYNPSIYIYDKQDENTTFKHGYTNYLHIDSSQFKNIYYNMVKYTHSYNDMVLTIYLTTHDNIYIEISIILND